jgi:DNA-binding transcriptional MerR regulator
MAEQKHLTVRIESTSVVASGSSTSYLRLSELAYHCGVQPELIELFRRLGLIDSVERDASGEYVFFADDVLTVRKILRLRNDLGVNYAGIGLVLDLMARIEGLEARIRELESRVVGLK